ncbi:MAG: hypothetical protein BGO57_12375 [Sphingomonadales bacterium 63-6]|nr:MAG: hypothetical protein BGO57_12375 [Sphingomonadales bacterium 63-6]
MEVIADRDIPFLRIKYETDGVIDAQLLGAMIAEVGTNFQRFERRRNHLKLTVHASGTGSWWIEFAVAGTLSAAAAGLYIKELGAYVGFLADVISIVQGFKKGKITAQDRKTIKALNEPIARDQARQVNIVINGDGNTVNIDRKISEKIAAAIDAPARTVKDNQNGTFSAENLADKLFASRPAASQLLKGLPAPEGMSVLNGVYGTVFNVHGEWYVRLEGQQGVLHPLVFEPWRFAFSDGDAFRFHGNWEGAKYRIQRAERILKLGR